MVFSFSFFISTQTASSVLLLQTECWYWIDDCRQPWFGKVRCTLWKCDALLPWLSKLQCHCFESFLFFVCPPISEVSCMKAGLEPAKPQRIYIWRQVFCLTLDDSIAYDLVRWQALNREISCISVAIVL